MNDVRGVPAGRAGRLWLRQRLSSASLATDLLERKLRLLRQERERFGLRASRATDRWTAAWRAADEWGVRAAVLGGRRELRLAAPVARADIRITETALMGVRYPAAATCRLPVVTAGDRGPGTAALVEAAAAFRAAVEAAVAHAAAQAALRTIDREVATTRRRRRAIADRLVPRLAAALARLTDDLEETERSEAVRLRWAIAPAGPDEEPS
jgi:V/A-type H+/Na+-transporting ATPase subunit D